MSTAPNLFKNPCSPQTQPAGIQYTIVLSKLNKQYALKLHLSKEKSKYLYVKYIYFVSVIEMTFLYLSAIAPLTIVVDVVANDI